MNWNDLQDLSFESRWGLRPDFKPPKKSPTKDWKVSVQITVKQPTRVVFNGPATIAFWPDGTKTVVKCQDGEPFDPEKGVALAMLKKYFGGAKYNDILRNLIKNATWDKKVTVE